MTTNVTIRTLLLSLVIGLSASVLALTLIFLVVEASWSEPFRQATPPDAFLHSAIGTELIPLAVLEVLPNLFPDKFPDGSNGGTDWIKKYGFLPSEALARIIPEQQFPFTDPDSAKLPIGFTAAPLRPLSAFPSPIKFVGLSCATCHSTLLRTNGNDAGKLILGTGNSSLNLLAFFEEVKAAILQSDQLNISNVVAAQSRRSKSLSLIEKQSVSAWIFAARKAVARDLQINDVPRVGVLLNDSRQNRAGPLRSNPFQSLIRTFFNRPGLSAAQNDFGMGFVKFGAVFEEGTKEWAQFDGTVRKLNSRSAFAAVAAGATVQNLSQRQIVSNVIAASDYVKGLPAPRWESVFPNEQINHAKAARGLTVYREHCSSCHGYRDLNDGSWKTESFNRLGEVVGLPEIRTDPERLTFLHQEKLPSAFRDFFGKLPYGVRESFPNGHPFAVLYDETGATPNDVRPATGYLNSPIPGAFLRAPFLHNASVLTMRELINLDQRRNSFYRGHNYYDTAAIGLAAPSSPDNERPWRFDTSLRGNSNSGHDYPWPYTQTLDAERRDQLDDLLEYLKFL